VMPTAPAATRAEMRAQQRSANLRTALALAEFKFAFSGYPSSLERLGPRFLPHDPVDLYTGQLPIYRPALDGYIFYSVGENMQDDNGRSFFDEPAGDDLPVDMLPLR
ncbi:MAG: hypothetical protein ACF8TS_23390, partial [Maioricimonas sp. JB049]